MTYSKEQILETLQRIKHPDLGKDIVSLNMIENIVVEDKSVRFTLNPAKANDPFVSSIKKACEKAIQSYLSKDINVVITNKVSTPEPVQKPLSSVKNIIAVASGKGGVGKSTIATNLAVAIAQTGATVGLIDADVYGPSIPKMFNVEGTRPEINKVDGVDKITPVSQYGVKMLSMGFFVNPEDALVWRGPMATNALKQIINNGDWGELDYLLIDLPPGTSDIHLTMVQEVAVNGAVIVSTPQNVALADVIKGINMFRSKGINVPVLGLVENMAWFTPEELPDNKYYIFGKDGCRKLAEQQQLPLLGQIPIVQSIREKGDAGTPAALDEDSLIGQIFKKLAKQVMLEVKNRNANFAPTEKVNVTHK